MFLAMHPDGNGDLVGYVPTMAEAKLAAYKTAAWALANGYRHYVMTFGPDAVTLSCPNLATMVFRVEEEESA